LIEVRDRVGAHAEKLGLDPAARPNTPAKAGFSIVPRQ